MATKTKPTTKPRARKIAAKTTPKPAAKADRSKKDIGSTTTAAPEWREYRRARRGDELAEPLRSRVSDGDVKKKLELPLVSTKAEGEERRYHIGALKPTKE